MSISAVVIGKNAAEQLSRCLQSVTFADEIIYWDIQSKDKSCQIAKKYTNKVFVSPQDSRFVEAQRNLAFAKASSDWLLVLDADEEIPLTLAAKLQNLPDEQTAVAYYLPRKNLFAGQWMAHTGWWPDYQLRFFKRGVVKWPEQIHAQPQITGNSQKLAAEESWAIIHHNYQDISDYLERFDRYTSIEAEQRLKQQSQKTPWRISQHTLLSTFSDEFFRRFFQLRGYRDGVRGLYLSLMQATYQITTQMKIYDLLAHDQALEKDDQQQLLKELRQFQRSFAYWLTDYELQQLTGWRKVLLQLKRKLGF